MTIDRRHFTQAFGAAALLSALGRRDGAEGAGPAQAEPAQAGRSEPPTAGAKPRIGLLVHPDMVLLDLVGPLTVFSLAMAELHLVWKDKRPVATDVGLPVTPNATLTECPADLDVLFVPGGLKGTVDLMGDAEILGFLADRGGRARLVTSVCTGSLLLAAAGLLRGYRATSHWYVRDLLPLMGATATAARIVVDRNRITGGGVTAGIDFGLAIAARLRGEDYARRIQLVIEYDPQPPFAAGSPEGAGAAMTSDVRTRRAPQLAAARNAAERARDRLGL